MVSNKSKGDKTEKEIFELLKGRGFNIIRSPRTMKRVFLPGGKMIFVSQANDFFGLFDLCAKKEHQTYWIQCKFKTPDNVYSAKKDIEEFYQKYCSGTEFVQIWLKVPRKGFVVYEYAGSGWEKEYFDLKGYIKGIFLIEEKKNE